MHAKDAIKSSMHMGLFVLETYLSDLDDADLMVRPAQGCNHLAWQLGHLISSESGLIDMARSGEGGQLPAGFREAHAKGNAGSDDPAQFRTKQEYIDLYRA
ncbi:MAG TPA: DinB family protein, partial [Lacipirellulaceae bacterium]|nr:DinB family protein [Lacipirellulaceae bacterium]